MSVIQEAFDIPADIMNKLLTGEYRRFGGVVRNAVGPNKGKIVKHLQPVDIKVAEQTQGVGAQILQFAKRNKNELIIAATITIATTVGIIYHKVKNRESAVVAQFRAALFAYIDKIRKGNLELETIETLEATLDQLKNHKNYEKFKLELSTEDLDVLVGKIYDYTMRLAGTNQVELTEQERSKTDNSIINLHNYLRTQKRVFEEVS